MAVSAALIVALAIASAGSDRVLLCRPKVTGDASLARGEAVLDAARRSGRFLDYGVVCEDGAEGARAARRVGLAHAVTATARRPRRPCGSGGPEGERAACTGSAAVLNVRGPLHSRRERGTTWPSPPR